MRGLDIEEVRDTNGILNLYGRNLRPQVERLLNSADVLEMRLHAEANMKQYAEEWGKRHETSLEGVESFLERLHLQLVQRKAHLQTRHDLLKEAM